MKRLLAILLLWSVLFLTFTSHVYGSAPPDFVVRVFVNDADGGRTMGTGILVANDLILTNNHVIRDRKTDTVTILFTDWEIIEGKVINTDKKYDLALIKIKKQIRGVITFGNSAELFDVVEIHGYGCGLPDSSFGVVYYSKDYIKISGAKGRSGDSGGPMLNLDGELVGILFGRLKDNIYGTSITKIKQFLDFNKFPDPGTERI